MPTLPTTPRWKSLVAVTLALGACALAGCATDVSPDEDALVGDGTGADGEPTELSSEQVADDDETASVSSELGGCNQCSNCVYYARCRQPRLPFGLTTYSDKVARINSSRARAGCVAVIRTSSQWGHVAYVNRVSGSTVFIDEGNWPSGRCGSRSGTAARLNIAGYICP